MCCGLLWSVCTTEKVLAFQTDNKCPTGITELNFLSTFPWIHKRNNLHAKLESSTSVIPLSRTVSIACYPVPLWIINPLMQIFNVFALTYSMINIFVFKNYKPLTFSCQNSSSGILNSSLIGFQIISVCSISAVHLVGSWAFREKHQKSDSFMCS